jgi:P27 family predicted phage terminase small subunit
MSRGRKSIPTSIKKMRGTLQPSRTPEGGEMVPVKVTRPPDPPEWLSRDGKRVYRKMAGALNGTGNLATIDLEALAAYANEMGLYIELERSIRLGRSERISGYSTKAGDLIENPSVTHRMAREALREAMKIGVLFGITPSARAKIPTGIENPAGDAFDNL